MEWPESWCGIKPNTAAAVEAELARELSPGHRLHGLPVRAIVLGGNGDDVLFEITDGSGQVAEVHLTWRPERDPDWPFAEVYPGWAAFRAAWAADDGGM